MTEAEQDAEFVAYVRQIRADRGMSLRELAERIDITPAYLSDMERGNRALLPKHKQRIAETLCFQVTDARCLVDHAYASTHLRVCPLCSTSITSNFE